MALRIPFGSMKPKAASISAFEGLGRSGLRSRLSPQKVKNTVTFEPIANAPLAMISDAIALSRSPENTTSDTPSRAAVDLASPSCAP